MKSTLLIIAFVILAILSYFMFGPFKQKDVYLAVNVKLEKLTANSKFTRLVQISRKRDSEKSEILFAYYFNHEIIQFDTSNADPTIKFENDGSLIASNWRVSFLNKMNSQKVIHKPVAFHSFFVNENGMISDITSLFEKDSMHKNVENIETQLSSMK